MEQIDKAKLLEWLESEIEDYNDPTSIHCLEKMFVLKKAKSKILAGAFDIKNPIQGEKME